EVPVARQPTTRPSLAGLPGPSTIASPGSTSARRRHSPLGSPRSAMHRPMSTRRSCPTCTRIIWGGCGGAGLLGAEAEWAEPPRLAPESRGFLRKHIQLPGLRWHQIGFEPTHDSALAPFSESLDVMGDGSLVLLPTPGHTSGSLSLLVRRRTKSPLLLVGDLSYGADLLERRQLPGV